MSGNRSSTIVGVVVAALILGAVGTIAYYQFQVAPYQTASTSSTASEVTCGATNCAHVEITSGSATCPISTSSCGYAPLTVTVVLGVNNTIVWTSADTSGAPHTVTGSGFSSPTMNQGDTYQRTFTVAGTYQYHCAFHPGMVATVVVTSG